MSDRELLELAAKAAGVEIHGWFGDYANDILFADIGPDEVIEWNPLTDDGDAFRLAVKLGLMVDTSCQPALILCAGPCGIGLEESARADPYAATRRAIVRAASEIGGAK